MVGKIERKDKFMTEAYLWQQVPNQGYNKYGKGVVGPGSKEVLDRAVNAHAGVPAGTTFPVTDKNQVVKIEVLNKPTKVRNLWGGEGTDYHMKRGDLRMTYGMDDVSQMHERWQAKAAARGKTKILNQSCSGDVNLMATTYRDATTGEYLLDKLKQRGKKFFGVKDANIGVTIPTPEMTHVLSSEAIKTGAKAAELKPGMIIASDALGIYTPPLDAKFLKKNAPVDEAGKAVFAKLKKFVNIRDKATQYAKEGLIPKESATKYIEKAWKLVQKFAGKIRA